MTSAMAMAKRPRPGRRVVYFCDIVIGDASDPAHPVQFQVTPFPPYWHLHNFLALNPGEFYHAPFWAFSDTPLGYAHAMQMWRDGCKNRLHSDIYSARSMSRAASTIHFARDLNTLIRVSGHPSAPMRTVLRSEKDYRKEG